MNKQLFFLFLTIPFVSLACDEEVQTAPTINEPALLKLEKPTVTILPKAPAHLPVPEKFAVTQRIHTLIMEKAKEDELKNYQIPVPKAKDAPLKLIAISGGEFKIGLTDGEQKPIKISPFWMSETEITWKHYNSFWQNDPEFKNPRNKDGTLDIDGDRYSTNQVDLDKVSLVDAVSQPTTQYYDMFMAGLFKSDEDYPAMDMTNHAATKFCQWLSAQTGHFYRLPTAAEWEYACKAGTNTTYSFGDDASKLGDYGWFFNNSEVNGNFTYSIVRQKKPNPWGLYDMHGNVAEWTIDGYEENALEQIKPGSSNPWFFPTKRYPRVIKGGSWDDSAEALASSARAFSHKDLKIQDPQTPNSVWYHTNGQHIGFRVVRPQEIPSAEEMHLFWNTDFLTPERTQEDL